LRWAVLGLAVYLLYFFGLMAAGLVGPDEPRYASIGREMASSGDWITPRLWGSPWFEKPPLLYWMIAAGFKLGLGSELAPRLPVALASVLFLLFFRHILKLEFGPRPAWFATGILATSFLWVAFSQVAVTDLPLSVTYSAAMLLALRWRATGDKRLADASAFLLGAAVLAKGLVPVALAAPLIVLTGKRWRQWFRPAPLILFCLAALPWYALMSFHHGQAFIHEFFGRHHFDRFTSGVTLHARPFWFYLPVLIAGFFPWSPLLALLFKRSLYGDHRRRFLLVWAAYGLAFFSLSSGKLPGYVLPLFPALAALLGLALAEAKNARLALASCVLLLGLVPAVAGTFPQAFAVGLSRAGLAGWSWPWAAVCLAASLAVYVLGNSQREISVAVLLLLAVLSITYLKITVYPQLDRLASARQLINQIAGRQNEACIDNLHRNLRYSLNYYLTAPLSDCAASPRPLRIRQEPGAPPVVTYAGDTF